VRSRRQFLEYSLPQALPDHTALPVDRLPLAFRCNCGKDSVWQSYLEWLSQAARDFEFERLRGQCGLPPSPQQFNGRY
jgi:hypothetical protein